MTILKSSTHELNGQQLVCLTINPDKINTVFHMKSIIATIMFLSLYIVTQAQPITFHNFKVTDIYGKTFDLATLKGKKVLVVNVASECGYTGQYKDLEALYKKYKDKNFVIIAFPANNFGSQEPGTNEQIEEFCKSKFGVTFPMMAKISVKGDDMHPLYQWLTQKSQNGKLDAPVKWNFQKFLIDEGGRLVTSYPSKENPLSENISLWIEGN